MKCLCNMWQLSGITYVHAMVGYRHMQMNSDLGVDKWYSQSKWYEAYQFSINHVYGPKFWKPTSKPPLPPVERKMPRRPRKRRIRHPIEDEDHAVNRVGRVMHCHKCWETGHNKTRCTNQERPKPTYLKSKGIVFHEAPSSSMSPPTAIPSSSNTMPPLPTPSGSNTMPPPHTPSGSNLCHHMLHLYPLVPKKRGRPAKSSASSSRGGSSNRDGSMGGSKGGASKRGRGYNTMPLQGLRDESDEHQFKMDMEVVYEIEIEQIAIEYEHARIRNMLEDNDEDDHTWMAFGGNTRDLGSFGEETDEITDLHQILEEVLLTERGDGVTGIKRRRRDPSSDGVKDLVTASRRSRLNEDLESST
ncbi:hypothetical protein Tco_0742572 [Tanacetum coccineum]